MEVVAEAVAQVVAVAGETMGIIVKMLSLLARLPGLLRAAGRRDWITLSFSVL